MQHPDETSPVLPPPVEEVKDLGPPADAPFDYSGDDEDEDEDDDIEGDLEEDDAGDFE